MSTRTSRATLEALVTAQAAKLEELEAKLNATAQPTAVKPPKAEKPLVTRGYFMRLDETTQKWVPDTAKPCLVISVPGAKPRKVTEENFVKELSLHSKLKAAYEAL